MLWGGFENKDSLKNLGTNIKKNDDCSEEIFNGSWIKSVMIPERELDRVMIPERISGKSENGGLGELSRGCITIESCTKWKKRKRE